MRNATRGMVFGLKSTGTLTQALLVERFCHVTAFYNAFTMSSSQLVKPQLPPELYPITGGVSRCH